MRSLALVILVWTSLGVSVLFGEAFSIEEGTIEGALFKVVRPADANGKLLMLAHGYRPEDVPLSADFGHADPVMARLIGDGWTIASTSYRRNGMIVDDAVADILNLREHIVSRYGVPEETYLLGGSMGGIIITVLAENHAARFDGGVAMGAALTDGGGEWRVPLSFDPQVRLIFLTNQSELTGPQRYCEQAAHALHPPALWRISRDGHTNISQYEQEAALRALVAWKESGQIDREKDGTIQPEVVSTARHTASTAQGQVGRIHPIYGNFATTFVRSDMKQLGISLGSRFTLEAGGHAVNVLMGTTYGDVRRGEWVAFFNAEGYLFVARNFENASESLGVGSGDSLTVLAPE